MTDHPPKVRRNYMRSHPWLKFELDLTRLPYEIWMLLGEARSKCEHIAGVPLQPSVANKLHNVYLSKGVHATTAIEGNTLSEEEVSLRLAGKLSLAPSREYLGLEVDNVLNALNEIGRACILDGADHLLTVPELCGFNATVLKGLALEKGVVPGIIRRHEVGVGKYSGAPAADCGYLLDRLCSWLNEPDFNPAENSLAIVRGLMRAVLSHLYIAWIHPFGDGNGRTARLVEFKILLAAGVPTPAAHLLSDHYNRTRAEYYRQLAYASESGGDTYRFLGYAVQGFRDGLQEQLNVVRGQQWLLAWRDYVHSLLGRDEDKVTNRRRHLILDLALQPNAVATADLRKLSIRVALDYSESADRTLLRDIQELQRMGLLVRDGRSAVRANKELITAFLPHRRDVNINAKDPQLPLIDDY